MDKYIFKKFTLENKILLTPDSMDYMVKHIKNKVDVDEILLKYKERDTTALINFENIKTVIGSYYTKEEVVSLQLKPWKFNNSSHSERYCFLKNKIKIDLKLIDEIEESIECTLFGVIYRDKRNKLILEDESGCIEIIFGDVNCFIIDFVFLMLQGEKKDGVFVVNKVDYLPLETKKTIEKGSLAVFNSRILFFYGNFSDNINTTNSEVFIIQPEDKNIREKADRNGFKRLEIDEYSMNNPVYLCVNGKTILLFQNEFFKNKENGFFLGKKYVNSLVRTYISQYDLSPFKRPHMYIDTVPDAFIIFQNSYSFINEIENVFFASLSPYKTNNTYLEYIAELNIFILKNK